MISVLSQGSEAIEEQIKEAEKLGLAYSRVDAARVEEANDAWTRMASAIGGVVDRIVIDLAPLIEKLTKDITRLTTGVEDLGGADIQRTPEQQKAIDDATFDSFFSGVLMAAAIDAQNREQARLEQKLHAENVLQPGQKPPPTLEELRENAERERQEKDAQKEADRVSKERADAVKDREEDRIRAVHAREEERNRAAVRLLDSLKTPADKLLDDLNAVREVLVLLPDQATMAKALKSVLDKVAEHPDELEAIGLFDTIMADLEGIGADTTGLWEEFLAKREPLAPPEKTVEDFLPTGVMGSLDINRRMQEAILADALSEGERKMLEKMDDAEVTRKKHLDGLDKIDRSIRESRVPVPVA